MEWETITALVFGKAKNFDEKEDSYQRRIYRIHGNALINANKIMEAARN